MTTTPSGVRTQVLGLIADVLSVAFWLAAIFLEGRVGKPGLAALLVLLIACVGFQSWSRWSAVKAAAPEERAALRRIAIMGSVAMTVGVAVLLILTAPKFFD